ncbi:MAG: hypothetical protein ACOY93_11130 [Bacillota bacterium]
MRIELAEVNLNQASACLPIRSRYALLEITEAGEWRVLLYGLKPDSLVILQDLFSAAEVGHLSLTTVEGDRTAGLVKVSRLSVGNESHAALQGLSNLP